MRVRPLQMGKRRTLDEEEAHSRADRPQAAPGGRRAFLRPRSRGRKKARHKRGDLPPLAQPLWRDVKANAMKRLKESESENTRLKKIVAEQELDIDILKEV